MFWIIHIDDILYLCNISHVTSHPILALSTDTAHDIRLGSIRRLESDLTECQRRLSQANQSMQRMQKDAGLHVQIKVKQDQVCSNVLIIFYLHLYTIYTILTTFYFI